MVSAFDPDGLFTFLCGTTKGRYPNDRKVLRKEIRRIIVKFAFNPTHVPKLEVRREHGANGRNESDLALIHESYDKVFEQLERARKLEEKKYRKGKATSSRKKSFDSTGWRWN